ncbi:MAG TPA: hypothetical protein VMV90_03355 [Rectinemataceae bacterium]|nr:hypothetical protein [Rectinemataceae bacterium]
MTHQDESSIFEDVLKVLTLREPEGLKSAITILMNAAMKIEREQASRFLLRGERNGGTNDEHRKHHEYDSFQGNPFGMQVCPV